MSSEIFTFEPDLVEPRDYSSTWNTISTPFDSGTSQFQQEWSRNINEFRFIYRGFHEDSRWNLIEAFFNARRGRGDNFYLPSWREETKLTTPYTTGVGLDLTNTIFFSAIAGKPGNIIHIKHPNGTPEEVGQVAEIVSGVHLNLVSELTYDFPTDTIVQRGYLVRFLVDKMPSLKYMGMDIFEIEFIFREDI